MTTEETLASWGVTKYKIHKDGSVDILQELDLRGKLTTAEFPFVIRKVTGTLWLTNTPIQSLGALESVGGWLVLENDKGYPDWKVFQKELEAYKLRAHECLEDVPLMLATAELAWQRACCEQAIRCFSA